MKSITVKTAALALVVSLGAACGTANAWGGRGYYHHGGGFFIGAALGLAAAGTVMALSPPTYAYPSPTYAYPSPYYAAPPVVYSTPQVVYSSVPMMTYSMPPVVAMPPQAVADSTDVIAYPLHGQSAAQQASDRTACEHWASGQSGYDPAQASQWTTSAQTSSYSRAIGACLKGHGYSIN
ncbi:hypothetical protein [Bordetella sp. FB-8]|uniref:hypothetical protein n=1 Tax=Bordetella sp. FB-8 TaxID=1159870 RepID=UPI000375A65F|nr:hypothetical protein [Bordetella sp. FB-8]